LKTAITAAVLVGTGGFVGSILRYGVSGLVHWKLPLALFPYGTLVVNLTGCLLIGVLSGLAESRVALGPDLRIFLLVGVLGSFTTFSTLGYETFAMSRDGEHLRAALNMTTHLSLGLFLVWLGYTCTSSR
jgi:CrcB protein